MVELHNLKPAPGSTRNRKRKGRGPGSGNGKNAGRGEKGQKSRSGGSVSPGFEGGQMPLHRRIPKRGFTPRSRTEYQVVNLRDLARFEGTEVNPQTLAEAGFIRSASRLVKVLGSGEIDRALSFEAHAFSGSARTKIEAAGGSATVVGRDAEGGESESAGAAAPEAAAPEAAAEEPSTDEASSEEAAGSDTPEEETPETEG